jgi:hypothetical protein
LVWVKGGSRVTVKRRRSHDQVSGTNRHPLRVNRTASVRTDGRRTLTHEGGAAYERDPESELFLLAVTNMAGEDTFYERAADRDARFVDLVHRVTAANPAFIVGADPAAGRIGFARYLRQTMLLRSASVVMAAEYVAAGGPYGRSVIARALQPPGRAGRDDRLLAVGPRPAPAHAGQAGRGPTPPGACIPSGPPCATTACPARCAWPTSSS